MLDLQAGVHLQKVKVLVLADDKFDRAGALVLDGLGQLHCLFTHGAAGFVADERAGGFFNHLLVPALDGAFALVQVNHVAEAVSQHLDFNVARLLHKLFNEDAVVAKAVHGLVLAGRETFERFLVVERHAQALAAAASAGFDHHGVANVLGYFYCLFRASDGIVVAGNGVDLGGQRQFLGRNLVAHGGNRMRLGADEGNAFFFTAPGKGLVLGQEAVARVNRLCAGFLGDGNDFFCLQVAFAAGCRANAHRLVGQLDMARFLVSVGIHRHGLDAHFLGSSDHAAGNLSAVGNQNFGEHHRSLGHQCLAMSMPGHRRCSSERNRSLSRGEIKIELARP